jgi:hypothetical protein
MAPPLFFIPGMLSHYNCQVQRAKLVIAPAHDPGGAVGAGVFRRLHVYAYIDRVADPDV